MSFNIRDAFESDAQAISNIYNYYVDSSTCTFDLEPESLADRVQWLESHGERHPVIVCTHTDDRNDEHVIGWGSLSQWHERPAYGQTVEVSFYVHHDWIRRGVGRLILSELIHRGRGLGHHVLIGGACTEQHASIKLQEAFGFTQVAHFKAVGRKFDRWLDVSYLQLCLGRADEREE